MSSSRPLPSLFGRFTAISQQHDQLTNTLRLLRSMCTALEAGAAPPEGPAPELLLSDLSRHLNAHFAAEEGPAYFGAMRDEVPALCPDVDRLESEHRDMRRSIERLCAIAADHERWREVPVPTRELIGRLERHERAESQLLRSFFSP